MKPYQTRKLSEWADVGDIRSEGRKSSVGRVAIVNGKAARPWSEKNELEYRGYSKSASKKAARRNIKRSDKAKVMRQIKKDTV